MRVHASASASVVHTKPCPRSEASAIGDGEGDRGMFEEVCMPIGFNINGGSANFPGRTRYINELREAKYLLGVGR